MAVRDAVGTESQFHYPRFFSLYPQAPNLGQCILKLMLKALRIQTLLRMFKAYRPSVETLYLLQMLGYVSRARGEWREQTPPVSSVLEGLEFLELVGVLFSVDTDMDHDQEVPETWRSSFPGAAWQRLCGSVNTKDSTLDIQKVLKEASLL